MNRAEFISYLERHLDDMFGLAMRLCKNKATAEDLVQDLFVNLSQKEIEFHKVRNPRAWLASVLYRLFVDYWRHHTRSPVTLASDCALDASGNPENVIDNTCSQWPEPQEAVELNEQQALVVAALNRLSDKHKHLLILHDMQGYTLAEIEIIMGIPVGTLKSRIHRAREKLQEMLSKTEPFTQFNRTNR